MNKPQPENWMREVEARQHNTVFPRTIENEARGWRSLIQRKQALTPIQVVGVALIYITLGAALYNIAYWQLRLSSARGTRLERFIDNFGGWILALSICSVFFLVMRWQLHRIGSSKKYRK